MVENRVRRKSPSPNYCFFEARSKAFPARINDLRGE